MATKIRLSRCTILAMVAGTVPFTGIASAQDSVDAVTVSDEVVPGDARVIETLEVDSTSQPPTDKDIIRPMPMVDDSGMEFNGDPMMDGRAINFDQATGKISIGAPAFDPELPLDEQWVAPADGHKSLGDDESQYIFGGRNMNALSYISGTTSYPWSANCRLLMRFVNSSGNNEYYSCSGTLVDYRTVLTAGHCIFNRNSNIMDWAAEVWVYPGYHDTNGGSAWQDADAPFGFAKSVGLTSYTGWTQNGDFNYDMAFMRLNKPIGAKTGTFGYGYNNNCSFFTTPTHHNASYPAESAYGWTGRYMYYRYGDFDSCPSSNRVQYNSAGYGGMSGSSSYFINSGTRYAYSVASTSDRATYTRHVDLWQSAFEYLRDTIITGNKPATWDLWAMCMESSTTTVTAGNALDNVRFLAANWSRQAVNGSYGFDVRMSTNDFISTGDTLLSTGSFSWNFGATSAVWVNLSDQTIPIGTTGGTRYLGTILNVNDASSSNNDSSGEEAHPFTVIAVRDPQAVSAGAENGTHYHGDTFDVSYTARNNGGASASSVVLDFRASTNNFISTADTPLGTVNLGTLSAGQSVSNTVTLNVPNLTGARYIGFIVTTTSTDANTSNNTAYDATTVTFAGRANMQATSVAAEDGDHPQTSTMNVAHSVRNDGTISSGNYSVEVRASTNTFISTADTLLRTDNYGTLGAGATRSDSVAAVIPAVLAPGTYYIGTIVSGGTNENDFSDNTSYDRAPITVSACLADWDNSGVVNSGDLLAYLNDYNSVRGGGSWRHGDPDIGAPFGILNSGDLLAFLNLYNADCD